MLNKLKRFSKFAKDFLFLKNDDNNEVKISQIFFFWIVRIKMTPES